MAGEVLRHEFTVKPEEYSDQEKLNEAIRHSRATVQAMRGQILNTGVYLGLPMSSELTPEEVQASIEAGYATIQVNYTYDQN